MDKSKGNNVERRDFIKATTFAGMAAALPAAGYAAMKGAESKEGVSKGSVLGSKPSPAGKERNLLFLSDNPGNAGKLIEAIRLIREYDIRVNPVKVDYNNPQDIERVVSDPGVDIILLMVPGIGLSSASITRHLNALEVPVILFPVNLDLIMMEADIVAILKQKGINSVLANSQEDVLDFVRIFSAPRLLEGKKALIYGRPFNSTTVPAHNLDADYIYKITGVRLEHRPVSDLSLLMEKVDESRAGEVVRQWKEGAARIVEPTDESLLKAGKMYILLRDVVDREGLDGISMDCLEFSFGSKPILPTPCMAYVKLRDEIVSAVCEADVCMMMTALLMQRISRRPFFHFNVSEVNTNRSSTILRHCVAPIKFMGPDNQPLPYNLRDYHGFGRDVVVEVEFPAGTEVTLSGFSKDLKSFFLWPGRIVRTVDDTSTPSFPNLAESKMRRFCSNKAEVKIASPERFLQNIAGIHKIFVAGNYTRQLYNVLTRMNVNVIAPPDLTTPEG
ncbi:MAG TPA: hypothetical protein VLL97_04210 [Acidobacteriota bacterium]|nr:hypothetical protein [Acidobacteriota bacterium]